MFSVDLETGHRTPGTVEVASAQSGNVAIPNAHHSVQALSPPSPTLQVQQIRGLPDDSRSPESRRLFGLHNVVLSLSRMS